MSRDTVNAICERFPGAELSDPWGGGHDAWKVGGKMFACIGSKLPGVNIKTDSIETAEMLIEMGVGRKAPYFHRSWVNVPLDLQEDELRQRLADSYRIVRKGLTRKAQQASRPSIDDRTLLSSPPARLRLGRCCATVAAAAQIASTRQEVRPWTWSP